MAAALKNSFAPGKRWLDTEGVHIQAHGGGVLCHEGLYYWYGEHKGTPTYKRPDGRIHVDVIGVSCYSSKDLYHWRCEGLALPAVKDDPSHDLHPGRIVERPKVIYNDRANQFVMWMHIDTPGYRTRSAGVAVSDSPAGPFRYLGSLQPNGQVSADQTLFKDDDGTAYHICASNWNSCTMISRLTDDYLRPSGDYVTILDYQVENKGKEAPAICKYNGLYHLVCSDCTGWHPNAASCAVSDAILGKWQPQGNPCAGSGAETTFNAQGTFLLPVQDKKDAFVFMADRWNADDLGDSRYVWLPVEWRNDTMRIEWRDRWDLSVFD